MADRRPLRQVFSERAGKALHGAGSFLRKKSYLAPLAAFALVSSSTMPPRVEDPAAQTPPVVAEMPAPVTAFKNPAPTDFLAPAAASDALKNKIPKLTYDQQVFQYNAAEAALAGQSTAPSPLIPLLPGVKPLDGVAPVVPPVGAANDETGAANNDKFAALSPEERQEFYMKQLCFGATDTGKAATPHQKELATALGNLSKMPVFGQPLLDLAAHDKIKFCALDRLPAGIAAQYLPVSDAVIAAPEAQKTAMALRMAHELTHAAQHGNHLLNYETDWDIQSRVTRNLSIEAAALSSEFMVAYEAKTNGDLSYWAYMTMRFYNTDEGRLTLKSIDDAYTGAIAAGATKDDALRAAGGVAWTRVFEDNDWRNFYLNLELNNYIADIESEDFVGRSNVIHDGFGAGKVALAGKVGPLPSFTANDNFPDFDALLKRNEKMRWAYQLADIARMTQMEGAEGKTVAVLKATAEADKNPYLGLDITEIHRKASDASWSRAPGQRHFAYLYQYMDDALAAALPPPVLPPKEAPTASPELPLVPPSVTAPELPAVLPPVLSPVPNAGRAAFNGGML